MFVSGHVLYPVWNKLQNQQDLTMFPQTRVHFFQTHCKDDENETTK